MFTLLQTKVILLLYCYFVSVWLMNKQDLLSYAWSIVTIVLLNLSEISVLYTYTLFFKHVF